LDIFDVDGRNLEFLCDTNGKVQFSQPELNRILATLHSAPLENSVASAAHQTAAHN
jgi:hypothetical protein